MTGDARPATEDELHAYCDGRLDPMDMARVAAWLDAHPDAAADVASWQAQNDAIRAAFGETAARPVDDARLLAHAAAAIPRHRPWPRLAAAAVLAAALFASGTGTGLLIASQDSAAPALSRAGSLVIVSAALAAHAVYTPEVLHPVEVRADQEQHLVSWLGKRLDYPLNVPDLGRAGYSLVGGRLVPVGGAAGAMFIYENAAGARLSLMVGRNENSTTTAFRFAAEGAVSAFYWMDGPVGYAITGETGRPELETVAHLVYEQLDTR